VPLENFEFDRWVGVTIQALILFLTLDRDLELIAQFIPHILLTISRQVTHQAPLDQYQSDPWIVQTTLSMPESSPPVRSTGDGKALRSSLPRTAGGQGSFVPGVVSLV
jgi:hypothetical protein